MQAASLKAHSRANTTALTQAYQDLLHDDNVCPFDASLLMVEKLKASSLSMLYDLNHLLSPEEDNHVFKHSLLECYGRGFIGMRTVADRMVSGMLFWERAK